MSETPVSVIIPNYNYEKFIGAAIESALAQSHKKLEIVVVDDGSSDNSCEVAAQYPVKLLRQTNAGVSAARNRGAAEATGEMFVFLDADDLLEPYYVATCLDALEKSRPHVGYAYTQMRYFGDQTGVHKSGPFSKRRILRGNLVNASAMVRRRAFEQAGGFREDWRLGWEDYELWVHLFSLGYHGIFIPEPLIRYRRHGVTRNELSDAQVDGLQWRMWWSYPELYWQKLALHPLQVLRELRAKP